MKKWISLFAAAFMTVSFPQSSFPQFQEDIFAEGFRIKPGLHFEYFERTITWDEGQYESQLQSYLVALNTGFQVREDFSVHAIIGYSSSNFDALVFRQLPFSVELDVGHIEGYVLGAELEKDLFTFNDMEIGIFGQMVYNKSRQKTWDIPGLSVQGEVKGDPSWTRASVGPVFKYTGVDYFDPYIRVCYNKLWGTFEMEQSIPNPEGIENQNLEGVEEKDIKAKSQFDATLGTLFHLSRAFSFKGEVHLMPYKGGVDLGILLGAFLSF